MTRCLDRLQQYLDAHGAHAELQLHAETFTSAATAAAVHEKGKYVAKVFMAWADGALVMFVLPAYARVDLNSARALLDCEHVRRAREDEFASVFPDCDVGAMPPFGNMYHLPVLLDRSLAGQPYLVFAVGNHTQALRMATKDYLRLVLPIVADFTVHNPEPVGL